MNELNRVLPQKAGWWMASWNGNPPQPWWVEKRSDGLYGYDCVEGFDTPFLEPVTKTEWVWHYEIVFQPVNAELAALLFESTEGLLTSRVMIAQINMGPVDNLTIKYPMLQTVDEQIAANRSALAKVGIK